MEYGLLLKKTSAKPAGYMRSCKAFMVLLAAAVAVFSCVSWTSGGSSLALPAGSSVRSVSYPQVATRSAAHHGIRSQLTSLGRRTVPMMGAHTYSLTHSRNLAEQLSLDRSVSWRAWSEQGASGEGEGAAATEEWPEGSKDEVKEGEEAPEEGQSEESPPPEEELLPTQKLFAVIEMAESAGAIPQALEENPSLKEEQDAYLKDLMDKGLIMSSGGFESQEALTGVWVVKADSLESALKIRDNSPYWTAGLIPNTIVRQWNAVGDLVSDKLIKELDEAYQELNVLKETRARESAKAEQYAAQVAKVQDAYVTVKRDFEMYEKRAQKEKIDAKTSGKGEALKKLMPMIDAFSAAFDEIDPQTQGEKDIDEAYRTLYRQMIDIFKTEGLEEVGATGEEFDPEKHNAVDQEYTDTEPDGVVMQVFRPGFSIDGRLIRAAYVSVSDNPRDRAEKEAAQAEANAAAAAKKGEEMEKQMEKAKAVAEAAEGKEGEEGEKAPEEPAGGEEATE